MPISTKDIREILKMIAAFGIGSTLAIGGFIVGVLGLTGLFEFPDYFYVAAAGIIGGAIILVIESVREIFIKKNSCKEKEVELQKLKNVLDNKEQSVVE